MPESWNPFRTMNNTTNLDIELLKREVIYQTDLEELIGKRPFESPTTYDAFVNVEDEKIEEESTEEAKPKNVEGTGSVEEESDKTTTAKSGENVQDETMAVENKGTKETDISSGSPANKDEPSDSEMESKESA